MGSMRRRARRQRYMVVVGVLAVCAVVGGWWHFHGPRAAALAPASAAPASALGGAAGGRHEADLIVDLPESAFSWAAEPPANPERTEADEVLEPVGGRSRDTVARLEDQAKKLTPAPTTGPAVNPEPAGPATGDHPAIAAARRLQADGRLIEARHKLNALLGQSLSRGDQAEVRRLLTVLADETIFSKRRVPDDPLTDLYAVQPGDVLVRIGRDAKVPPEVLMRINGIKNASALRADEKIKILKGPFHVKIHKAEFRMDVFLQDLYVRSFRVGLGADQGTPEGVWRVKERLENPTYYPPPSSEIKRIVPADDPQNPLGEHWIGLEGVEGDAKGRYGFGIHGTIDPDSIGKAVSLGCVRMHNEDVALLYTLMLPGQSTVTILP